MLWPGRDASTPRSHHHKAERYRQLRPAAHATVDVSLSDRPRWQLAALSACAAAAGNGTFFSQRLGQLRAADAHALARLDLRTHAGDRPIGPVGDWLFQ